ncbi:hypothetical protein R5R35_010829 [Gryllus longicercus]|uniref:Ankyrin repeat domain-containing protein 49 n=1 Tax=Gryllus longicercus TaxID=2509291 RepID=A0AAN9WHF0_9ORTH
MPGGEPLLPFVSGWDDDSTGIEEDPNPRENPEKEILLAAENGELEVVRNIIMNNRECIHVKDGDGYTPLHRACYNDHVEIVDILLEHGADIHARTKDQWQPLHSACMWNNTKCVAKLLEHGADVNATSEGGQTPLHLAAGNSESIATLALLLTHPLLKPDIRNKSDETAAQIARRSNPNYWIFESVEPCLNVFTHDG